MKTTHLVTTLKGYRRNPIVRFCLPLFFILMAESASNYVFPLITHEKGMSTTTLGIILSASAIISITTDLVFPRIFKNSGWKRQLISSGLIMLLFPLFSMMGILTGEFLPFLLASFSWFLYYEIFKFAEENMVVECDSRREYTRDWSVLFFVDSTAYIVGPIVVASFMDHGSLSGITAILVLSLIGVVLSLLVAKSLPQTKPKMVVEEAIPELKDHRPINLKLFFFVLPGLCTYLLFHFIDELIFNLSGLLGMELHLDGMNWLFLVLALIPFLIVPALVARRGGRYNQQHMAVLSMIATGACLTLFLFIHRVVVLELLMFAVGVFIALTLIFTEASFSRELERLHHNRVYLLRWMRVFASLGYVCSPFLSGLIADHSTYQTTFGVTGVIVLVTEGSLLFLLLKKQVQ